MNYTTQKGLLTELHCQNDFTRCGILLSQPIINDSRYDFLADINGIIYKIQCKTASPVDDKESAIGFAVYSKNWNNSKAKDYHNQIDYFYTWYNDKGYLISIDDVGVKFKTLRFTANTSSVCNNNITWAKDCEFDKVLQEQLNYEIPIYNPRTNQRKQYYCKDCKIEISKGSTYCRSCAGKHNASLQLVEKPSREELKYMIRTYTFTQIGRDYSTSDSTVRKWCDSYNLPRHSHEIQKYSDSEWLTL